MEESRKLSETLDPEFCKAEGFIEGNAGEID